MSKAKTFIILIVVLSLFPSPIFKILNEHANSSVYTQSKTTAEQLAIVGVTDSQTGVNSNGLYDSLNFNVTVYDYGTYGFTLNYSLYTINSLKQNLSLILQSHTIFGPYQSPGTAATYIYGNDIVNLPFSDSLFYNSSSTPQRFKLDLSVQGDLWFEKGNASVTFFPGQITLNDAYNYTSQTYDPTSWSPNPQGVVFSPPLTSVITPSENPNNSYQTSTTSSSSLTPSNQTAVIFIILIVVSIGVLAIGFSFSSKKGSNSVNTNKGMQFSPKSREKLICSNCYSPIAPEDVYCANCGNKQ